MSSYSFGHLGTGDLRGNDKYAHLKIRPETPEDEARLEALRRMSGGEDIWLDVRSVMLYLQIVSMGLDLVTDTTVCLYVTTKDGAGVKTAALADGTPLSCEKLADGRWLVSIPGIMSHRLNEVYDVRILTTGGTSAQVRASALSYVHAVFTSEKYKDDMDAQLLATALWRYWKAADAFVKS